MPSPSGPAAQPAGSSGTGTGQTANVYTPANQPATDAGLSNLIQGIYGPALAGLPSQTPASQAYPQVQAEVAQLTNNPYAAQAQGGANQAASIASAFDPTFASFGGALAGNAIGIGGYAPLLQNLGYNPIYQNVSTQEQNNPYYPGALAGAQKAAGIGDTAATQAAANSTALSGAVPGILGIGQQIAQPIAKTQALGDLTASYAPKLTGLADQVSAPLQGLQQAGQSVWQTAQDPRNALYNRTLNQVQQQQNVANAQAGVAATPYGASVAGDATRNFNIDWQNQQLQRQLAGLAGLGQADTQAAGLGSTAGNLVTGAGALNQGAAGIYDTAAQIGTRAAATDALGGQVAQSALGLGEGATSLEAGSANLPNQAFQANLAAETNAANQQLNAGLAGTQGIEQLLQSQGNIIGQGQGIVNNAVQGLLSGQSAPYNTSVGQAQTGLGGLINQINAGNQQYVPAQQAINDAESYLGLGQSASGLSGQLGQLGVNQNTPNYAAIGQGLGAGSNLLFGSQGLTGALGLGNSGLVGALGGGSAGGLTGIGAESAGIGTFSGDLGFGGGAGTFASAGTGAADAAGGSSILDFLPAIASS